MTVDAELVTPSRGDRDADRPDVSVIVPVFNEQEGLAALFERLYATLDGLNRPYECVFVDDGSRDRSAALLREQFDRRPETTRVIYFQGNFGQHAAILAGFKHCRGVSVITLDADLQNPPEEIVNLLEKLDEGYDYVGTIRRRRRDYVWRRVASKAMNYIRDRITNIRMTDQGCMLRAYGSTVIKAINSTREINTFVPALAYLYAINPIEIEVEHSEREAGASKYSLYRLIRLNFDLLTGFSIMPLQVFSFAGVIISLGSLALFVYMIVNRLVYGPDVNGIFTLFAIVFFFIGILLFGIGLLGEYIGRIYEQVRRRPRFLIRGILDNGDDNR